MSRVLALIVLFACLAAVFAAEVEEQETTNKAVATGKDDLETASGLHIGIGVGFHRRFHHYGYGYGYPFYGHHGFYGGFYPRYGHGFGYGHGFYG